MPYYLVQTAYKPAAIESMIQHPEDWAQVVHSLLAKLGGRLEGSWLAFGDYDTVTILLLPNEEAVAAFSMAILAGGSVRSVRTTPLLSWSEGLSAMRQAASLGFASHPSPSPAAGRSGVLENVT